MTSLARSGEYMSSTGLVGAGTSCTAAKRWALALDDARKKVATSDTRINPLGAARKLSMVLLQTYLPRWYPRVHSARAASLNPTSPTTFPWDLWNARRVTSRGGDGTILGTMKRKSIQ